MCGIFGYVGSRSAQPILIEGLRTLEYRGYDSAGIFIPNHDVVKAVGPIDALSEALPETLSGTSGIAHTRWATHGIPSEANAHPHHDMSENLWLVHNGIIENHRELKEGLRAQGCTFYSETDTEVLAKLIGMYYQGNLLTAVQQALHAVQGAYGMAVMHTSNPDTIVVARYSSPLVLGLGIDGNLVSSDPSALLAHTKDVVYLEDGEIAVLTKDSYDIQTIAGSKRERSSETLQWSTEAVKKDGYDHFMQKEIFEAPEVIKNTLRGRLIVEKGKAKLGGLEPILPTLTKLQRLQIIGCGSAYYAGQVGRYILEEYADLPVDVELASEYRYKQIHPHANSAVLAISQSGETADTRASLHKAKDMGLLTLGVVNVVGSAIARETDAGVYNHAGPEVAVASTKAFLSQLSVLALITLLLARDRNMSQAEGTNVAQALATLPKDIERTLGLAGDIQRLAEEYATYDNMMYIGRKFHAPIAYEGALKIKEVSYVHAEAYAGGELKHGPIAMLDENFPIIALVPEDDVYDKMVANIEEVRARQAPVLAITTEKESQLRSIANDVVYIPKTHPIVQPILTTVALQLFAYYVGVARGLNVDRPRNLAKSVTVE